MANAFQTLASGVAMLKNWYQGPLKSQFNDDCNIYRGAELGKESWSGLQVIRPLKVRRNQGVGASADNGILPAIGSQGTVQATIKSKFHYLRFGVTGPMIKASQSDKGSFVRSAAYELEEGYKDLMSDLNRALGQDSTANLALVNASAVASTTVTVGGRVTGEIADKFLDIGMEIDIWDTTGTVQKVAGATILSLSGVNTTSVTLGLDQPVTCVNTDRVVHAGALGNESDGLLTALDGGTSSVYGVARSSYKQYQGSVVDAGGSPLTLDLLNQVEALARRRGGDDFECVYSDFDSERYYRRLLLSDKRYVNTIEGDGGFSSKKRKYLEFGGKPWVPDKDMQPTIVWINQGGFTKYILAEMDFADETGSMMIAQTDTDAFEVRVRNFLTLFAEKPAGAGRLKNYVSP